MSNIAANQSEKVYCWINTDFNEAWWHYPDQRDGNECSRVVVTTGWKIISSRICSTGRPASREVSSQPYSGVFLRGDFSTTSGAIRRTAVHSPPI